MNRYRYLVLVEDAERFCLMLAFSMLSLRIPTTSFLFVGDDSLGFSRNMLLSFYLLYVLIRFS